MGKLDSCSWVPGRHSGDSELLADIVDAHCNLGQLDSEMGYEHRAELKLRLASDIEKRFPLERQACPFEV